MAEGVVVCGAQLASCICAEPPGHELPHKCAGNSQLTPDGKCKGQWNTKHDIVRYPTGETNEAEAAAAAALLRKKRWT